MSETRVEQVGTDDGAVPLTVAEPAGAALGGLVVLHEGHGVTADVDGVLTALAAEGWLAVAPHLFHRGAAAGPDEAVAALTAAGVLADCDAAFAWLAGHGTAVDRVGVLGFDLGGAVALVVAAQRQVGAAVSVSPTGVGQAGAGTPTLLESVGALTCPWLGLFGEDDPAAPAADVEALREAAARADVATHVVTYPGVGHRFDADPRDGGEAAAEARARVFAWFDGHLR